MGHPCDRTVQDILVSNERGDAKSQLFIGLPVLISEVDGWLQSCLGMRRMRYFDILIEFSSKFLRLFCNEKQGGLWMAKYSFVSGRA